MANSPQEWRHNVRRVHVPGAMPTQVPQPPSPHTASNAALSQGSTHTSAPVRQQALPDPSQVEQMAQSTMQQIRQLMLRSQGISLSAPQLKQEEIAAVQLASSEVQQRVAEQQSQARNLVAQRYSEEISSAVSTFVEAGESLASGAMGKDSGSIISNEKEGDYLPYLRIGSVNVAGQRVNALVPFLCTRNLWIETSTQKSYDLLLNTLLRIAATFPLKHLRFLIFDPRITGRLGALAPIRAINGRTFPQAFTSADAFADALDEAMQSAATNTERMAVRGKETLLDLWNSSSVPEGELTVAVLLDHPYGIKERLQKLLDRAADIGPASGLSLIIQSDPALALEPNGVTHNAKFLHISDAQTSMSCPEYFGDSVAIEGENAPSSEALAKLFEAISAKASSVQGPTYPLYDLIESGIASPWSQDSTDGLTAVIGKSGQQNLEVSFRSENPPTPNMLVGGAVGQGKSNLLLDIIFSLAVNYSPEELELLLLDFKRGLEFKRFDKDQDGQGWMPHVKVLSLESNQEFGVAALQYVEHELERRSQLFKEAGAHSITDYRKSGSKLSRVLLIIDEFHVLFDGDDANVEEAVRLLEVLAKQGRAYGIHILLASQTTSGISGLRVKGDSIFAQFPLRMSLKNTVQESQAILAAHNTAAADLTYRGEVVFNKNFGQDPAGSNIRGVAAWVDSDKFSQIQHDLWVRGHAQPPMVFIGSDYAAWDIDKLQGLQPGADGMVEIWLGRPIAITDKPYVLELDTDTNQGIALIGTGDDEAFATIGSTIVTGLKTLGNNAELVVLCGLNSVPPKIEDLLQHLRDKGIQTTIVSRKDVPDYLVNTLAPKLDDGEDHPTIVLGLAMQRIPGMDKTIAPPQDDFSFDFSAEPAADTGNGVIAKLTHSGGLQQMFFLGWWSALQGVTETLGYSRTGISKYLILKVGLEDVREIAGPLSTMSSDHPRVTVFNKGSDEGLVTLVPFSDLPDEYWS